MIDLSNRNVHIITTKEIWDQKISEAMQDGKMVSIFFLHDTPCSLKTWVDYFLPSSENI